MLTFIFKLFRRYNMDFKDILGFDHDDSTEEESFEYFLLNEEEEEDEDDSEA